MEEDEFQKITDNWHTAKKQHYPFSEVLEALVCVFQGTPKAILMDAHHYKCYRVFKDTEFEILNPVAKSYDYMGVPVLLREKSGPRIEVV